MFVMKRLEKVALAVAQGASKEERKQLLQMKLTEAKQHFPETFKLPLNPQRTVRTKTKQKKKRKKLEQMNLKK